MKIEESTRTSVKGLHDRCRRATQIFVTATTRQNYPNGNDALGAAPITPAPPTTKETATPHILLLGPFRDEPDLVAVAIYIGIGFIEVRDVDDVHHTYGFSTIDGDGIEKRYAYLQAAFGLYFDDVKIIEKAGA